MSCFGIIFFISIAANICSQSGGNAFDYNIFDLEFDVEINRQKCNGWGQMKCWSGQCANITGKCNGVKDCADGSDETDYFCRGNSCEENQYRCGYGACVPMKAKCNGTQECWDGTDELQTLCTNEMYTRLPSTIWDPIISITKSNKSREQANAVLFEDIDHYHTNNQSKSTNSTLSLPNVEIQTPIFENSLSIDNSFESNSSAQIHTNLQSQTEVVSHNVKNPEKLTTIKELEITKSKIEGSTRPLTIGTIPLYSTLLALNEYNITKTTTILPPTKTTTRHPTTVPNRYNISKTTTELPPTKTTTKQLTKLPNRYNITKTTHPTATTKALKECVLRSCSHPLLCNTSVPGSQDSEIAYDTQGRLYFIEGSQVTFNCAAGYNLEGESRLTCTPSGWNHKSPSCSPYCNSDFIYNCTSPLQCFFKQSNTRSKVPIRKSFAESRVREHTQISFACDEGYQLEGHKIRKCTVEGWSNEMPRCVNHCDISDLETCMSPLKCKVFDSSMQRLVEYRYSPWVSKMKENSYFEYRCEDGYKMTGESRSTCMNNGWSSNSPTCSKM